MFARAPIELQCVATDDFFPAEVGPTQPAGDHAAEMIAGLKQPNF